MSEFSFYLQSNSNLVIVDALVNDYPIRIAIDTAATNTVIDRTSLDIISLMDKVIPSGSGEFETANGMKSIDKFKVASFSCFGIEVIDFEVYSFDFITQNVFYEFHGIFRS